MARFWLLGLMLGSLVACASPGKTTVNNAWALAALAKSNGAAYFVVANPSPQADALVGAQSDIAETVELHTTEMQGNTMHMAHHAQIAIPANSQLEFKPGGMHVMLINLKRELKSGETFTVTLQFQNTGTVSVPVQIKAP